MQYHLKSVNLFLILSLFNFTVLSAQSPYELRLTKDVALFSAGLLAQFGGTSFILNDVDVLTQAQIAQLDKNDINGFDRKAVNNYSNNARQLSDVFLFSSVSYP